MLSSGAAYKAKSSVIWLGQAVGTKYLNQLFRSAQVWLL